MERPRSRGHARLHAANRGLLATILGRSELNLAAMAAAAPRGRDEQKVEMAGAAMAAEAHRVREEQKVETSGSAIAAAAPRSRDEQKVETAGAAIAAAAPRGSDQEELETAGFGDGVLLERTSTSRGSDVLLQSTGTSGLLCGDGDTFIFMVGMPVDVIQGGAKKATAADVFLARATRGGCMGRLCLAVKLGPVYWIQEVTDWLCMLMGSPRHRMREAWTWHGVVGVPIMQDDDTCAICATLVCLEARHRLDFERRHGVRTFPYYIPAETVADLKNLCRGGGVWTAKDGADEQEVLEVIQMVGGSRAAARPGSGWKPCDLQVRSWKFHFHSGSRRMPPSKIAEMLYKEGPVLGAVLTGKDYYAQGWQDRVYRGVPRGEKGSDHLVVCMGYSFDPDLQIEVVDNHEPHGPVRWILARAFTGFCEIHVEPLDARELQPSRWGRLMSRVCDILRW